jgi:hypothetical protein
MTEGQLLGDETVEFGWEIGRHVGLREHYITIGVWFERWLQLGSCRSALPGKPVVAPGVTPLHLNTFRSKLPKIRV